MRVERACQIYENTKCSLYLASQFQRYLTRILFSHFYLGVYLMRFLSRIFQNLVSVKLAQQKPCFCDGEGKEFGVSFAAPWNGRALRIPILDPLTASRSTWKTCLIERKRSLINTRIDPIHLLRIRLQGKLIFRPPPHPSFCENLVHYYDRAVKNNEFDLRTGLTEK